MIVPSSSFIFFLDTRQAPSLRWQPRMCSKAWRSATNGPSSLLCHFATLTVSVSCVRAILFSFFSAGRMQGCHVFLLAIFPRLAEPLLSVTRSPLSFTCSKPICPATRRTPLSDKNRTRPTAGPNNHIIRCFFVFLSFCLKPIRRPVGHTPSVSPNPHVQCSIPSWRST